jgi:hypothetical protein
MASPQQGVIERFTNEGEGMLGEQAGYGVLLTYTGGIVAGKAEGRGTVRCEQGGGWTLRDAHFRGGRMLPCIAVYARDNGDAYAGPLDPATSKPPHGARAAIVRGMDGSVFQGDWPDTGGFFFPYGGAAVVFPGGSVHRVTPRGKWAIWSDGAMSGWGLSTAGWGPAVCVVERPTADEVHPPPPARPPAARPLAGVASARSLAAVAAPTVGASVGA